MQKNSFRGEKRLPSKREPQVLPSIEGTNLPFLVFAHAKKDDNEKNTHTLGRPPRDPQRSAMINLPDLSSHTGTSTSLRVALGLRSLLDLHTAELAQFLAKTERTATYTVATPSLRRLGLLVDLLSTASTEEHMVLLTVLLERVLCASEGLLSKISWQPLLLCCFLLTSKELDDDPVSFRDLRMLAVMHDVRSAAAGGQAAAKHGESFSSCYNEDIEDIELALLQLLQWSTFCSAADFEHHRQRVFDRSVELMAEPNDGSPGSSVLGQADWEYMHERLRACMPPAGSQQPGPVRSTPVQPAPVRSSPALESSMLDAVESFLEDFSADHEEGVPSLASASDEEDAQPFIEQGLSSALPLSRKGDVPTLLDGLRWKPEMPKWFDTIKSALKEVLPRDLDRELATANWVDRELGRPGRPSSRERPTCRGGPNGLISPSSRCDADGLSRPWVVNMMVDGGKLVNQPGKSFV